MSVVVQAVKDVGNAVSDAVSTVGKAVSDVGNFVVEKVVEPVAKTVEKTIDAAIKDPVGTAVKIAAISTGNPYLIAAANTGVALAHGESPEDALKSGAKAALMYEVGTEVGEYVAPEAAAYFGPENAAAAAAVTNAAASTAAAVAVGEDPYQALLTSGVNSAASVIAKQVPGYDSLTSGQQKALKTTIAASLQGKDPSQALVNQALQAGINYVKTDPEIQNVIPASTERTPETQDQVDAIINGTAFDTGTKLTEAQQDFLQNSLAGGDDEVISQILNEQLSPLTTGDATPLPPVEHVDLTADNIVPEGVERTPSTQEEIDALLGSGLTEDAYAPIYSTTSTEPTAPVTPTVATEIQPPVASNLSEVDSLVQSGLVEEPVFKADYGLSTGADSLGPQPSQPAEVFAPDGSVNYELTGDQSGLGLQQPETPNLPSMGGGQGLTAPAFGQPGGTVSESGVFDNYIPPAGTPSVAISKAPNGKITYTPIQRAPSTGSSTQTTTLDDLLSMLTGEPSTPLNQEELIKVVKASPYFDIRSPLDVGFFDNPSNQGVVKIASGGYMDAFSPQQQLSIDEILRILEGR